MPIDMLVQEAQGMTDESLMEVIRFMQFLKTVPSGILPVVPVASPAEEGGKIYRRPGLYKGRIRLAEGFDDPLDDFEEYM